MRRSDREVTDFNDITGILSRSDTIRLGLRGSPYPYIVPLSFGFETKDGHISIYFHGAKEGLKHELIRADNRVCVEADIFHQYVEVPGSLSTAYESFIGFGKALLVNGDEAEKGMALLLDHCRHPGMDYNRTALDVTAVYRVDIESFTGKRRTV